MKRRGTARAAGASSQSGGDCDILHEKVKDSFALDAEEGIGMKKKKDALSVLSAVSFMLVFVVLLAFQVRSALRYGDSLKAAETAPHVKGGRVSVTYADILMGRTMGMDMPESSDEDAQKWYEQNMPQIREDLESLIFNGAAVLTGAAFIFLENFLYKRNAEKNTGHCLSVLFTSLLLYAVFVGVLFIALAYKECYVVPQKIKPGLQICGILSMLASVLFFAKLLRLSRRPGLMAFLNLPLAFVLYYVSLFCELTVAEEGESMAAGLRYLLTGVEWLNPLGGIYLCATTPQATGQQVKLFMIKSCVMILILLFIWRKNRKRKKVAKAVERD